MKMMMGMEGAYEGWDEVNVSNEKGRREVHFYLKRSDGFGGFCADLAVIGKEKSVRHMSYSVQTAFLLRTAASSIKLRSRREVIEWLSSFVPTTDSLPCGSSAPSYNDEDSYSEGVPTSKGLSLRRVRGHSKEFSWLGSSWICKKRRRHYQSFYRNGVKISVHDFVYVMAEENKRLVAYLEDLYEDSRGNNMVLVRWFHKIDEVGIVLPPEFNDREIFFSLCLQDLSVECIDGIASVLNPQHFEKFLNEARHTHWEPYLCYRQFDNDDVKPFDITQVQGYWNQELLRYMYTFSSKSNLKPTSSDSFGFGGNGHANMVQSRPKRKHGFKLGEINQHHKAVGKETSMNSNGLSSSTVTERHAPIASSLSRKVVIRQNQTRHLSVGGSVEVLSQDSGMRGCWFQGIIVKRHRDKLKIRYQDILDAEETGNLEEWVLASRVAKSDEWGFRLHGRTTVRPNPPSKGKVSWAFEVGTAVDARWHDGWWEGIVVRKESEDKIHVYFPGERQSSIFAPGDLRHSMEWVCNKWNNIKERPDLVNSVSSDQGMKSCNGAGPTEVLESDKKSPGMEKMASDNNMVAACNGTGRGEMLASDEKKRKAVEMPIILSKDQSFAELRWNSSSKKRRRGRDSLGKIRQSAVSGGSSSSSHEDGEPPAREDFSVLKSLKVDRENCKYGGDHIFVASVPPLSSLVMSR